MEESLEKQENDKTMKTSAALIKIRQDSFNCKNLRNL